MKCETVFSSAICWLQSTEMFARPSKKIPGKWKLFEYYSEPGGKLVHINEAQLKEDNLFLEVVFSKNGEFLHSTNIPFKLFSETGFFRWNRSKNFITLIHPDDFSKRLEFQFSIERDILKLLKKDTSGKIEIFAFLKKEE